MSFAPYTIAILLPLIGGWLFLLLGRRSKGFAAAPAISLLGALLLLYFRRPTEPLSLAVAGWSFEMTDEAWRLSLVVLLLGLAVALPAALRYVRPAAGDHTAELSLAAIALLGVAALLPLWAADLFTQTAAYALFGLVWLVVAARAGGPVRMGIWLLAPTVLNWFAAATAAAGQPRYTLAALLVGAWFAAGAWPLTRWRDATVAMPDALRVALMGMPVVPAAGLLMPQAQAGGAGQTVLILVTVLTLVGLALGLRFGWERPMSLRRFVDGLAPGLAGLVIMAAVWLDARALFAAVQLAVFLPALLMLIAEQRGGQAVEQAISDGPAAQSARPPLRLAVLGLGYLALAGLPFTVGFGVLAPLYAQWGAGFRIALLVVMVLLLSLWLAAASWLALRARASRLPLVNPPAVVAGLLPVVAGLLSTDLSAIGDAPWLTWVALGVPVVAGLLVPRLLVGRDEWRALLHDALTVRLPAVRHPSIRRAAAAGAGAVREATAILEGNGGLLWLLALLVLLFFLM